MERERRSVELLIALPVRVRDIQHLRLAETRLIGLNCVVLCRPLA